MSKETRAHKLLNELEKIRFNHPSENISIASINSYFEIIHSEAVQATIMASNKPNFSPPKFRDDI